jgi:hypothetical protein
MVTQQSEYLNHVLQVTPCGIYMMSLKIPGLCYFIIQGIAKLSFNLNRDINQLIKNNNISATIFIYVDMQNKIPSLDIELTNGSEMFNKSYLYSPPKQTEQEALSSIDPNDLVRLIQLHCYTKIKHEFI